MAEKKETVTTEKINVGNNQLVFGDSFGKGNLKIVLGPWGPNEYGIGVEDSTIRFTSHKYFNFYNDNTKLIMQLTDGNLDVKGKVTATSLNIHGVEISDSKAILKGIKPLPAGKKGTKEVRVDPATGQLYYEPH